MCTRMLYAFFICYAVYIVHYSHKQLKHLPVPVERHQICNGAIECDITLYLQSSRKVCLQVLILHITCGRALQKWLIIYNQALKSNQ